MLPLVRKIFARDSSYLEAYGNTFIHACNAMVKYAAGNDLAVEEAVRRKIESLQEEVASPNPSPLERILSERIALRRTVP